MVRVSSEDASRVIEVKALMDTEATLTVIETGVGVVEVDGSRAFIDVEGKSEIVPLVIFDILIRSS
jgi:hypothetical protein